jgi:hypothetical protein
MTLCIAAIAVAKFPGDRKDITEFEPSAVFCSDTRVETTFLSPITGCQLVAEAVRKRKVPHRMAMSNPPLIPIDCSCPRAKLYS